MPDWISLTAKIRPQIGPVAYIVIWPLCEFCDRRIGHLGTLARSWWSGTKEPSNKWHPAKASRFNGECHLYVLAIGRFLRTFLLLAAAFGASLQGSLSRLKTPFHPLTSGRCCLSECCFPSLYILKLTFTKVHLFTWKRLALLTRWFQKQILIIESSRK